MTSPAAPADELAPDARPAAPSVDDLDARIDDALDRVGAFIGFWFRLTLAIALSWLAAWLLFLSPTAAIYNDLVAASMQVALLVIVAVTVAVLEIAGLLWLAGGLRSYWVMPRDTAATLDDLAAQPAVQQQARLVAAILKGLASLKPLESEIPRGLLLIGSPRSGSMHLAASVAAEAGVPLAYVNAANLAHGLPLVPGMRLRALYARAGRLAGQYGGCMVFIDGVDAFVHDGGAGSRAISAITDTVTQPILDTGWRARLARAMGFRPGPARLKRVLTVVATSSSERLPPALSESPAFSWRWTLDPPGQRDREMLIAAALEQVHHADTVSVANLASATQARPAGAIRGLINTGLVIAAGEGRHVLEQRDLDRALELEG